MFTVAFIWIQRSGVRAADQCSLCSSNPLSDALVARVAATLLPFVLLVYCSSARAVCYPFHRELLATGKSVCCGNLGAILSHMDPEVLSIHLY